MVSIDFTPMSEFFFYFTTWTNHKPPLGFLGEMKVPNHASGRIIPRALVMLGYLYKLVYRSVQDHQNTDSLSRLPHEIHLLNPPVQAENILLMDKLDLSPATADIAQWTKRDLVLAGVGRSVLKGWPKKSEGATVEYFRVNIELSLQFRSILRGSQVVVSGTEWKGYWKTYTPNILA